MSMIHFFYHNPFASYTFGRRAMQSSHPSLAMYNILQSIKWDPERLAISTTSPRDSSWLVSFSSWSLDNLHPLTCKILRPLNQASIFSPSACISSTLPSSLCPSESQGDPSFPLLAHLLSSFALLFASLLSNLSSSVGTAGLSSIGFPNGATMLFTT